MFIVHHPSMLIRHDFWPVDGAFGEQDFWPVDGAFGDSSGFKLDRC